MQANVHIEAENADLHTYAPSVIREDTQPRNAQMEVDRDRLKRKANLPRYRRGYGWGSESSTFSVTIRRTETNLPLPRPSQREYDNIEAMSTIDKNPNLFKIITPVKVDVFEELLTRHPNKLFVESVCRGFREGFWPHADTHWDEGYPMTWDNSWAPPKSDQERVFLHMQRDEEMMKGRYSSSFGPDLLPGMYSTPIHAVPKPRSDKFRLVVNHSAGKFSPNSMIPREAIQGAPLDTIVRLGADL
ncbi:hypothetical protein K435DRAFT_702527, partial [Dendrothele bispora CBS 962.96]